jgi:teichuronic acid biosynthesis glycosyltransferase TuaG
VIQATETPTVSIVTPAYRAARFLPETIASVQAQTRADFEMLVVDDCSPDNTAELVAEVAAGDPRIRLIRHRVNGGPAAARNTAIEAARGRFIAFLDSDDLWMPNKLERQVAFMETTQAAISCTQFRRVDESGQVISPVVGVPCTIDYRGLLKNTVIVTSSSMVNPGLTGPFRLKKTFYDDYALWLDLLGRGLIAHGIQEELVRYRVLENSWSRNKLRSAWHVWRTYRDIERIALPTAAWCFAHYAWNGYRKYRL